MKTSDCPTVLIMCLPVERFPLFPHIFGEAKWRSIHILKSLLQSLKSHCSPLKDLSSKWSATDTFSCLQTFCCPRSQLFVYDFTYFTCNLVGYQHLCVYTFKTKVHTNNWGNKMSLPACGLHRISICMMAQSLLLLSFCGETDETFCAVFFIFSGITPGTVSVCICLISFKRENNGNIIHSFIQENY